ncbi:MAG TPA: radical SAM protein [Candidatus Tripitaka californicus]|uniref:radical SAM protein n=1 Tax=Candidatus Tripitaka californicus TaxID=3367616 RepID=UPI0040256A20|nr:radical SAM protein [Planctomycetota bacterium]
MQKIRRKSLLYKSRVEFADFCINHVEGCSHGCRYPCYAMMMKKRCGVISSYEDWCRPKIVENALELLERELSRYNGKIKSVHLCFSTDPFMFGYDEIGQLSLRLMRRLNSENIPCTVLTKGVYPKEIALPALYPHGTGDERMSPAQVTEHLGYRVGALPPTLPQARRRNKFGITLVSLDEDFRRDYEPNAAGFEERIKSLRYLHEKGFKTWVSMEPYPTPNIIRQDLLKILEAVSFADEIIFGRLNYSPRTRVFSHSKTFYNDQAKAVVNFCKRNNISYYIKDGTIT